MHTTMVPSWSISIKTGSHKCHLQHWKHFGSPYCVVIVPDRNIYHIPDTVHPEFPSPNQSIRNSHASKISVYTSRYYDLDDNVYPTFLTTIREEMDLFTFIRHADPTKGRVIPLANEDDHADRTGQDEEATIVLYEEFQAAVADKPKGTRKKRKAAGGASGFNLPPKKLKEDHDTSGDASASTAGKSLVALQGLLECSTLAMEIGAM
ncbi:hypothetical protein Tco_0294317 [Tanacetum coccineum]